MATLATLRVKLIGDTADYQAAMSRAGKTAEKFKQIGGSLQSAGLKLTAGVTAPLVGLGLVAVNAASDMEESISKVGVVFGDNKDDLVEWASSASTSMGMTQQAALEAIGTYGNLLTALGVVPGKAMQMSQSFVELSADLASFNNASPEETLLALRSALTGEFEPMKRFGVALSQAAIEQQALKMGLIETKAELTPAIKAQAGYALILEQTATAQGDFERTSDGLANKTRIVKAQFMDAAAAIGQQLLPVALKLANVVSGWIERFQGLTPHMQKVILIVAGVAAAIGPLLMIVGTLISTVGALVGPVTFVIGILSGPLLLVIGAVIAVIALLALAWKNNWGDIQGKTKKAIDFIRNIIQSALKWIQDFWKQHGEQILATARALWDAVIAVVQWFVDYFSLIFEAFSAAFSGDWETFGAKLREAWDMVWEAVKNIVLAAWDFLKDIVPKIIASIISFFRDTDWGQVGRNIIQGIANGITAAASLIKNAALSAAKAAWAAIKGFFGIDSPSRLMMQVGTNLMNGLAKGILSADNMPALAMTHVAEVTLPQLSPMREGNLMGSQAPVIVYGGLHLHGVEDKESLLESLSELMP